MHHGLVLEGGGLRGLFTAGVLDVMLEHGLAVDGVIGVSAGALFGVNYLSHQHGRALRYNLLMKDDPRYMGWRTLLTTGEFIGAHYAYHVVPFTIDPFDGAAFEANTTPFWMVCSDVVSAQPVYHRMTTFDHTQVDWLRASGSMPLVSRPVTLDGHTMLDGGLTDSIPLRAFQQMGYDRNIVVLTQPRGYRKRPIARPLHALMRLALRRYPAVARLMAQRPAMYNAQLDYAEAQAALGNTLLIYPDQKLDIGRVQMDERRMRTVYQAGRDKALQMLPQIRQFSHPLAGPTQSS